MAVQSLGIENVTMNEVLNPLFGDMSQWILAVLISGICFSTYITFVGAASRLFHSLVGEGYLPRFFANDRQKGLPIKVVVVFGLGNIIVLTLVYLDVLNIESVVSIANGFFILNAVTGLIASVRILDHWLLKATAVLLSIAFCVLMFMLSWISFVGYLIIAIGVAIVSKD